MWFRDRREKEQQRLCKIQRDDDAVTSQAPQEPTTPNAGDALLWIVLNKAFKITSDLTMKLLLFLLLRIIYEQAVTRSVKTENQDAFQRLLPFDIGKSLFPKGFLLCCSTRRIKCGLFLIKSCVQGEDIFGGRVVIKAMNSKKEEEEGNERTTFENVAKEIIKQ
ncbi:hypothetical protein IGI04_016822 [Brassica rapa subsp. trilocularis]|uniref:Uncharacterized protein n=1 Tax=Brassica rapa subsp. trilocularis TaxID=1813537 RepID=A0ABQ7MW58_BRACM|nr:hypothetical protein IGI04_016366 [Brassica rapa subsp. trilocularis]KAG5402215.1 hypothetical protein IGI04_016822 [Brassica rapa subsp. trilocularis]